MAASSRPTDALPDDARAPLHRPREASRSRASLGAIVAICVLADVGLVAAGVGLGAQRILTRRGDCRAHSTRTDAGTVAGAAEMYVAESPGGACPTVGLLVAHGFIGPSSSTTDCWGRPFAVECDGTDITVRSAGPDGQHGTKDDIE